MPRTRAVSFVLGLWLSFATACRNPGEDNSSGSEPASNQAPAASTSSIRGNDTAPEPTSPEAATRPQAPGQRPHPAPDTPRVRVQHNGVSVVTHSDCLADQSAYDLLVHFHGTADIVERNWASARLGGVLAVVQTGEWGRDYKARYQVPGAFEALLREVDAALGEICPERPPRPGRIALSGFSAGYAAVRALLREVGAAAIDAALLSDGLHAGLVRGADGARQVLPEDVRPFVTFGKQAQAGNKLLSITHSAVHTAGYASTTETSDYLLSELGLQRKPVAVSSRGSDGRRVLLSEVKQQGFMLRGYSGDTGPDHGWHLQTLGDTLLTDLRAFWDRDREPGH